MIETSLKGRLLVATPSLGDPNFERTVVFLLGHSEEGAVGVVLNRPSELEVSGHLPDWDGLAATPPLIFVGGPVQQDAVIGLAVAGARQETDGWSPLTGGLGTVDLSRPPADVDVQLEEIRIFAGYAGWGEGQLENEISVGAWFVIDGGPADAMTSDPDGLWPRVLRRQGGHLAMFATYPSDPSVN